MTLWRHVQLNCLQCSLLSRFSRHVLHQMCLPLIVFLADRFKAKFLNYIKTLFKTKTTVLNTTYCTYKCALSYFPDMSEFLTLISYNIFRSNATRQSYFFFARHCSHYNDLLGDNFYLQPDVICFLETGDSNIQMELFSLLSKMRTCAALDLLCTVSNLINIWHRSADTEAAFWSCLSVSISTSLWWSIDMKEMILKGWLWDAWSNVTSL